MLGSDKCRTCAPVCLCPSLAVTCTSIPPSCMPTNIMEGWWWWWWTRGGGLNQKDCERILTPRNKHHRFICISVRNINKALRCLIKIFCQAFRLLPLSLRDCYKPWAIFKCGLMLVYSHNSEEQSTIPRAHCPDLREVNTGMWRNHISLPARVTLLSRCYWSVWKQTIGWIVWFFLP